MESIQPYLDYFAANPEWAIIVIFLIAFGEALLIIGLFVPSTVVLVGAGMLVGTGHLGFWPVFLATAIGAILGDQLSYWAGRLFGLHLKEMWPLNRYRTLVSKGEDFVRQHGGKSIAIGRFVPGVKAVVPGVVGMLGMNQPFFIFVNVTSGIFWAACHVFPGMLLGQGLALAGELSGRLVLVLIVLLVLLGLAGWIIRLVAAGLSPYLHAILHRISLWARASRNRAINRFGRAIAPSNPRAMGLVLFAVVALACLAALTDLVLGLVVRDAVSNLDLSLANLMATWRNAPADELMVRLTMLADKPVLWGLAAVMIGWLFFWRAWRAGLLALIMLLAAEAVSLLLGIFVSREPPVAGLAAATGHFPSQHALMAGLVFGMIAVLSSHAMGRWSKAAVASICGSLVVAIAFSRVYLASDWLSDVLGGILAAAILCALFGMAIEAVPSRRIRPMGLMGVLALVFVGVGALHVYSGHDEAEQAYAKPSMVKIVETSDWIGGQWRSAERRRVDLAGQPEEEFALQWVGDLGVFEKSLAADGWKTQPLWRWPDAISYLDHGAPLANLPPRPLLHEGLKAKLTLERADPRDPRRREVLRLYDSQVKLQGDVSGTVYLASYTQDVNLSQLMLFSIPGTVRPEDKAVQAFVVKLSQVPDFKVLARATDEALPTVVLGPAK